MVGGGQLARMTHQAAIALGQSLRVLAAVARRPRRARLRRRAPRQPGRPRRAARSCPRCRGRHLRPREASRASCCAHWSPRVSPSIPGPTPCCTPRTSWSCAARSAGIAGMPAYVEVADTADVEGLAAAHRLAGGAQGRPRRLRRPRGVAARRARPGAGRAAAGGGHAADGRAGGDDAPRAGRAGGALARSGRPRRGRSSRPCSADGQCVEVLAPAPGLDPATAVGGPGAGPADRRARSASPGCWPSSCSTPTGRPPA